MKEEVRGSEEERKRLRNRDGEGENKSDGMVTGREDEELNCKVESGKRGVTRVEVRDLRKYVSTTEYNAWENKGMVARV